MTIKIAFSRDPEFTKLLGRRTDVDLTYAALELARDAYPSLDFNQTLGWINARRAELAGPVARAKSEIDALRELAYCLGETHGIAGDQSAYERADSSYLNRVIETKRGIPISLSVLYIAVAQSLGLELQGVGAPMHFLTRFESCEEPIFLDAFSHGRILTLDECVQWLQSITGMSTEQVTSRLQPIIIRMLTNLKSLYTQQKDWAAACVVQQRLTALLPTSYLERRDLGMIALRANRPGQAIDVLQTCLKTCPSGEADVLKHHICEAQTQLAHWN